MAYRAFLIPVAGDSESEAEMNVFLRNHRVLSVEKQFVAQGTNSFWAFCVDYQEPRGKQTAAATIVPDRKKPAVNYREELGDALFRQFEILRKIRKQVAKRHSVPVYVVFNNEQLVAMARNTPTTRAQLGEIPGIGSQRLERYADDFLPVLQQLATHETNGQSVPADPGAGESA